MEDSAPWWFYILVFALLFYFNPSEKKHEEAVVEKIEDFCKENSSASMEERLLCNEFGLALVKMVAPELISRQNLLFFSLTKLNNGKESKTIGFGVANFVFIFGDLSDGLGQNKNDATQ